MMAVENPILSLKNLNDLEGKIRNNQATAQDYEEIDFFITSLGVKTGYIKAVLLENGIRDFNHYIRERAENNEGKKVQIGKITGSILGALSFLKGYVIKNNL